MVPKISVASGVRWVYGLYMNNAAATANEIRNWLKTVKATKRICWNRSTAVEAVEALKAKGVDCRRLGSSVWVVR